MTASLETGVLYRDDNLTRLSELPTESVDLVYLDPPFFSNRFYEVVWGDEAEVRSFEDRWEGGIQHYIDWMRIRIEEMHRVLKSTGSIYLHCDPHASHYLKVMLDETFGGANFRSEVVWKRTSAHNSAKRWGPVHDLIFLRPGDRRLDVGPQPANLLELPLPPTRKRKDLPTAEELVESDKRRRSQTA